MSPCPIDPEVIKKLSEETIEQVLEAVLRENGILQPSVDGMLQFIRNPEPRYDKPPDSNTRTNPNERFVGSIKEGFIEGNENQNPNPNPNPNSNPNPNPNPNPNSNPNPNPNPNLNPNPNPNPNPNSNPNPNPNLIKTLPSLQILTNTNTLEDNMYRSASGIAANGADTSFIWFTYNGNEYKKNMCELYSEETINDICNNEMADYNKHLTVFKKNLKTYTTIDNYQTYLGGIINERLDFLDKIKNKINTYKQNNFIDNRKNSYLSSNLEFYNNLHFYIFILYYAIFIAFLIFSNFIKDKLYENKYVMIYVVVILIIPFILRYFLLYIYNLYISYIERNYLKLDEISYKYLVEETDHQKTNKVVQDDLNNFYQAQGLM